MEIVLFVLIVGGVLWFQVWKSIRIEENKERLAERDRKSIKEWRDAGRPKNWPVKKKDTTVIDKEPITVITKNKEDKISIIEFCKQKEWFVGNWVKTLDISPAEQKIIDELIKYDIHWEREVSFRDMILPSGYYSRYDFYLVDHNVIIEYDGKEWHSAPDKITNDTLKQNYCENNGIKVIRYNSQHYYHIPYEIADLMNSLKVKSKFRIEIDNINISTN